MGIANTYVRARIDTRTKELASEALETMGLSVSDAIRLLMIRIAEERRLPFNVKAPNATTRKAITELESGKGKRLKSINDLIVDLYKDENLMEEINIENEFGSRLKSERVRLGLSQEELASRVGITPLVIYNYEKSKSIPSLKTLYAFDKAGMNLSFLVFGQTLMPSLDSFSPAVIEAVSETIRLLEITVNHGPFTDIERLKASILLLQKMGQVTDESSNDKVKQLKSILDKTITSQQNAPANNGDVKLTAGEEAVKNSV